MRSLFHKLRLGLLFCPFLVASPSAAAGGFAVADLPRLQVLWSAPFLYTVQDNLGPEVPESGIFMGWDRGILPQSGSSGPALVSLNARSGKQLSRIPWAEHPYVQLAGDIALVWEPDLPRTDEPKGRYSAWQVRTGKRLWRKRIGPFAGDLEVWRGSGRAIGLGLVREWVDLSANTKMGIQSAVAVDLQTGDLLWRMRGASGCALASGREGFYAVIDSGDGIGEMDIVVVDPIRGEVLRKYSAPSFHPQSMQLLPGDPERALVAGERLAMAVSMADGRVLWQYRPGTEDESGSHSGKSRGFELRGGRLFARGPHGIRELHLPTGKVRAVFTLPPGLGPPEVLFPGPDRDGLVILARANPNTGTHLAVRFKNASAPPVMYAVSDAAGSMFARDNVLISLEMTGDKGVTRGYSPFVGTTSEAKTLDPLARVKAILQRRSTHLTNPDREELAAVPGYETLLMAMARDPREPLRREAFGVILDHRIPGFLELLRAEIVRPLPTPKPVQMIFHTLSRTEPDRASATGARAPAPAIPLPTSPVLGRREDGTYWSDREFEEEFEFRGRMILALAELDDSASAPVLTSMLFDSASPTGYARPQVEKIGVSPSRTTPWTPNWEQRGVNENVFSHCLQSPCGLPEQHAAVYRMLARLGRPADHAALRRFDSATSAPGGWAHLCDDDDAIRKPFRGSTPVRNGLGLCKGWDLGDIRVAKAEALWLRRRRSDGSWGPPAWAYDPGGDETLYKSEVQSTRRLKDGKIRIDGMTYPDMYTGKPWSVTLDPRAVFADKDGDGLADLTEKALGTDPARADTDGDGIPDGKDPAPRAAPDRNAGSQAADGLLHYLTVFESGGPVGVYADQNLWSGGGGARGARFVMHWPRQDRGRADCKEYGDCENDRDGPERIPGIRRCEEPLAIRSIRVEGDTAYAEVAWPSEGQRVDRQYRLAKVDGKWRVIR